MWPIYLLTFLRARFFNFTIGNNDKRKRKWLLTKAEENKLVLKEGMMERRMLEMSLRDHVDKLPQGSGVKDIVVAITENKIRWTGHAALVADDS